MMQLNKPVQYLCSHLPKQFSSGETDIESILSRETVIALQDNICGEINAPTTIIQLPRDNDGSLDRIDSQVSAITLRTSCDLLRRCVNDGGKLCLECDAEHSKLLLEMSKDRIESGELDKRINEKQWEQIHQNPYHQLRVKNKNGRVFLAYNCPMLGYRELVFPIFFEKNVIAVFFVCQIRLKNEEAVIRSSKSDFFSRNPDIFDGYLRDCRKLGYYDDITEKYTNERIKNYIIEEEGKRENKPEYPQIYGIKQGLLIPDVKDHLSSEQYDGMVFKVCKWLDDLEKQLYEEMKRKWENCARDVLAEALSEFHADTAYDIDQVHSSENRPPSIQKTLWTPAETFAKKISEQCALEYIVIYGVHSINKRTVNRLRVVAFDKISSDTDIPESFSLENPPEGTMMRKPSDNRTVPDLFNMLNPIPRNYDRMSIVFQPMMEISAASVVILVKYSSELLKVSIENAIISSLQNLAALISSRLAVLFENAAQQMLEKTLRLYKHEMVSLSSSISRAIHDYLGNPNLKDIDSQKLYDVYRDAAGTLSMFEFLSNNIGILIDDPIPPEKKLVQVYHDLLYKWENIRRVDARDKGCDIEFRKSSVSINTDPRYAEIVVYNLLTNAVKYAYDNTMIYVHCEKPSLRSNDVFSVTNFTFSIHETPRKKIFELRYRTQNAREYYPEGSGTGLWIVRKVMDTLGGKVKLCEPEWISDYNVPLLHAYVNFPDLYTITDEEFQKAEKEYHRLRNEYITNDFGERQDKIAWIIARYNWSNPTRSKVKNELYKATYLIKFEVNFNV